MSNNKKEELDKFLVGEKENNYVVDILIEQDDHLVLITDDDDNNYENISRLYFRDNKSEFVGLRGTKMSKQYNLFSMPFSWDDKTTLLKIRTKLNKKMQLVGRWPIKEMDK